MESKQLKSGCTDCCKITNHQVLFHKSVLPPEEIEYDAIAHYYMIECCGCGNISFRHEFHDYENMYQVGENKWDYNTEIETYPKFIDGYHGLKHMYDLPQGIRKIYQETLDSIKHQSLVLAGVGLRMIIEAITIEEQIKGNDLKIKISNMIKKGLLSQKDANRLHAIRFLGNDAAHDIKSYKLDQVLLAFEIVEHLLKTLYIFDQEAESKLEMPINTYDSFLSHVITCCSKFKSELLNNIFSLKSLLGRDTRRIIENYNVFEQKLIEDINTSKFTKLTIDRVDEKDGKKTQMYKFTEE